MVPPKDRSINKDLTDVRSKLLNLNKRVKQLSDEKGIPTSTTLSKPSEEPVKDIDYEAMRAKLRTVNAYLRKKMDNSAELPTQEAPAQEIVREEVEPQLEEVPDVSEVAAVTEVAQVATPSVSDVEEKTTLDLPDVGEAQELNVNERCGVGLDLGTAYLVASREIEGKKVFVKNERNSFLSVRADKATIDLLERLKIKYAALGDQMYVLGNLALNLANVFNREVQRSMQVGILNPSEAESIPILQLIVKHIIWEPRKPGELCCFSIPADPIDREQDTIYHKGVFEGILRNIGYSPIIIDEGYAVVLSELGYKDFTGIGVSCGGGMVNACAAYRSVPALSFSITRGGDWIDQSAASVLNMPVVKVTTIKEQGMSIKEPNGREEEAIAIYYRNYIRYFLESMSKVFMNSAETPQFNEPVDIVFAGGSSMVKGFLDVVMEEVKAVDLVFPLGQIKMAEDPFTSVSRGCLFNAINSDEES